MLAQIYAQRTSYFRAIFGIISKVFGSQVRKITIISPLGCAAKVLVGKDTKQTRTLNKKALLRGRRREWCGRGYQLAKS